jgi:hypothetical protein
MRPSRRQRFAHRDYEPTRRTLPPTAADLAAKVHYVTYVYPPNGSQRIFPVLALDADHAWELGDLRMAGEEGRHGTPETMQRLEVRAIEDGTIASVLSFEDVAEWECRQTRYQERQTVTK